MVRNIYYESKSTDDLINQVQRILSKKLSTFVENFDDEPVIIRKNGDIYYTIKFVLHKNGYKSIRFNYGSGSTVVESIDFWKSFDEKPDQTILIGEGYSIIQMFEAIKQVIIDGKKTLKIPDDYILSYEYTEKRKYKKEVKIIKSKLDSMVFGTPSFKEYLIDLSDKNEELPSEMNEEDVMGFIVKYNKWAKEKGKYAFNGIVTMKKLLQQLGVNIIKILTVQSSNSKEAQLTTKSEDDKNKKFKALGLGDFTATKKFKLMVSSAKDIVDGRSYSMIVAGDPGVGKTYEIKDLLLEKELGYHINNISEEPNSFVYVKGKITPVELYTTLFYHRKGILVLDDCDAPLKDPDSINILKAVTDNKLVRHVNWSNSTTRKNLEKLQDKLEENGYDYETLIARNNWDIIVETAVENQIGPPPQFIYTGRIIVITNLYKKDLDSAFYSRSDFHEISLTQDELMDRFENVVRTGNYKILNSTMEDQLEVLKIMDEFKILWEKTDFRKFEKCVKWYMKKHIEPDWKLAIANILYQDPEDMVKR